MKYIKIQQDILKDFLNEKIKRFMFIEDEEFVTFSPDGYALYRIPKEFWMLNSEWIKKKFGESSMKLENFYKKEEHEPAAFTGTYKDHNKLKLMEIQSRNFTAYVNEKFMKVFDNPSFSLKSQYAPIGVYEDGELVGLVCPVRV